MYQLRQENQCRMYFLIESEHFETLKVFPTGIHKTSLSHLTVAFNVNLRFSYEELGSLNPFNPKSNLTDFTLCNARQFYLSKGDSMGLKGLKNYLP